MAQHGSRLDQFENIATISVVEANAGTLIFAELQTGVGFGAQRGLVIDAIQYWFPVATIALIAAAADIIHVALTISNGVTDITNFTDRRIIDIATIMRIDFGTSASGQLFLMPVLHKFGMGIPVAEQSLYLGLQGISLTGVATARCRIFFRYIDLGDREILEIAQNFQLVG